MTIEQKARRVRSDILRMLYGCQSGHPGGSLSCVEMLLALYESVMRVDPARPRMEERDRFVFSKGHGCPALYAVLADRGFFPREELWTLRQLGSRLQGHPDMLKTPGVDASTGSLGQGISIAVGMALAGKRPGRGFRVYCIIGDGEAQEGLVWEAAMAAAHYRLDNLTVLMDFNGLQIDGSNDEVMSLGDIAGKFRAFGWETAEAGGHDVDALTRALKRPSEGRPRFLKCRTVKGKGVSFMENAAGWHGRPMSEEEYRAAMRETGDCDG